MATSKKKWVANVTTDSTHPPEGLFNKSAGTIARTLASKKVSPKGPGSGMRMLTYYLNRGGKGLSAARKRELEKAKSILSDIIEKGNHMSKLTAAKKNSEPKSDFGLPEKRKYPMPDAKHARNAKARASKELHEGQLSAAEKKRIDAKADKILKH